MPFDPLTIVFAVVAILVVWKLNGVLGQTGGFQREQPRVPPKDGRPFAKRTAAPGESADGSNVVRLPGASPAADPARWAGHVDAELEPAAAAAVTTGLGSIAAADPAFAATAFLDGARTAYEAIVTAFAAGERRTLQSLLMPDVFDGFNAALLEREASGAKLTTTLVSEPDPKFRAATLHGRAAEVAVRFQSKQISTTHGRDGSLVDGSPDGINDVDDVWTFTRDVSSRDPNWKLAATQTGP